MRLVLSATAIVGVRAALTHFPLHGRRIGAGRLVYLRANAAPPSRGNLDEIDRRVPSRGGETSDRPCVQRNSYGIETGQNAVVFSKY
jgi:hypothetical protein